MRHGTSTRHNGGFTLIELLIVIGIIGFLAAAVLVAVDPVKRIQDSRDARRYSEANGLLNAVLNKQVDDRTIYDAASDAPIVTSATNAQVIVTSTSGIDCTAQTTRPGCNQTLDTSGTDTCIANFSDTITGTGTLGSVGTAVTGVGTAFLTEVHVGDTLTSVGQVRTVTQVLTDTTLTTSVAFSPALNGTATFTVTAKNSLAPNYIASIPTDPRGAGTTFCGAGSGCTTLGNLAVGSTNSGYYVHRTSGNRVEVGSCKGEQTDPIFVKR